MNIMAIAVWIVLTVLLWYALMGAQVVVAGIMNLGEEITVKRWLIPSVLVMAHLIIPVYLFFWGEETYEEEEDGD